MIIYKSDIPTKTRVFPCISISTRFNIPCFPHLSMVKTTTPKALPRKRTVSRPRPFHAVCAGRRRAATQCYAMLRDATRRRGLGGSNVAQFIGI